MLPESELLSFIFCNSKNRKYYNFKYRLVGRKPFLIKINSKRKMLILI